jgi:hypothetical protein
MTQRPPSDTPQARQFWKNYIRDLSSAPRVWAHKGENLIHAFEAVASASVVGTAHLNMHDQALMLAGMSIEVFLKAILVSVPAVRTVVTGSKPRNGPELKLWSTFYNHNLLELAFLAQIPLADNEQRILITLSQHIFWRGRYIVPTEKGVGDLLPVVQSDGSIGQPYASVEEARALINRMIVEVKARLYA